MRNNENRMETINVRRVCWLIGKARDIFQLHTEACTCLSYRRNVRQRHNAIAHFIAGLLNIGIIVVLELTRVYISRTSAGDEVTMELPYW